MKVKSLGHVQFFATPWTVAHQAPPSMGVSRQEYWSGVPGSSPYIHTYMYAYSCTHIWLPRWLIGKESACQCRRCKRRRFDPCVRQIPWRRVWQPTAVFLPGKSHGQRSPVVYSPCGHKESDMIEHDHNTHTHIYIFICVYAH